jgi:hypothetical protein
MKVRISLIFATILVAACAREPAETPIDDLDFLATEYLMLELSMGLHDGAHVDAYFGPQEIRAEAESAALSLAEIESRAALLGHRLRNWGGESGDAQETGDMQAARIDNLLQRLRALHTRIALNRGETPPFDEESRRLFGVSAPDHDAAYFEAILEDIDALLDGEGDLSGRVNRFREQFVIPPDRISAVFDASIAECRRRTLLYIELPANESFELEYVNDKPWSGYNWYQGNSQSLIQINTDLPIFISRAVDLGCHEGYPGHHTFNALLEKNLVRDRGWTEFSLYPLFGPQSLIAEGSGNYGIELGTRRRPIVITSCSNSWAAWNTPAMKRQETISMATSTASRRYSGCKIIHYHHRNARSSKSTSSIQVDFFDTYRSYVINYNLGKDMVRDYIERDTQDHAARWHKFERLLSSPMSTTDLND